MPEKYNNSAALPQYGNSFQKNQQLVAKTHFMRDDADYVSIAEDEIKRLGRDKNGRLDFGSLTTSKIRNILSMVSDILNEVHTLKDDRLTPAINNKLKHLKIRLVYEAGRDDSKDKTVKRFITETGLLKAVDEINGDKKKFIRFANYLESLVAYHRFHGGKD